MKEKVIENFKELILKKYKKEIKAIWLLSIEGEDLFVVLVDDLKTKKEKIEKIKDYLTKICIKIKKEAKKPIHIIIKPITEYYDEILENKIDVFLEIKKAKCLYDPSNFLKPIKKLIDKGEIRGTKEALFKLMNQVRINNIEIKNIKIEVLSMIYSAIIDAAEAALIAKNIYFIVPKQIPNLLEKQFFKKRLISKKTLDAFKLIYETYKKFEHNEIKEIDGKLLDEIIKKADIFISDMQELIKKTI